MWQTIIVISIVALAGVFIVRRFARQVKAQDAGCGCSGPVAVQDSKCSPEVKSGSCCTPQTDGRRW